MSGRLKRIAQEPFFQFMALGLLIWAAVTCSKTAEDRYTIDVGPTQRERIVAAYVQQFGRMPDAGELRELIAGYVREEIYLREAMALALDRDDEIVRRRLIQKYEFLQSDRAVPQTPEPSALEQWFEQHKSRYATPERVAFSHVYFSADVLGERAAKTRAIAIMQDLQAAKAVRAPQLGDAFPGPSDVSALSAEEAARLFGQSELVDRLFALPIGDWHGPYRSGYGWHLVRVTGHVPSVLPDLSEVRERVVADCVDAERRSLNARSLAALMAKYRILYEGSAT